MTEINLSIGNYSVSIYPEEFIVADIRYERTSESLDSKLTKIRDRLKENPENVNLVVELADTLLERGHIESALREYELANNLDSRNLKILLMLAMLNASEEVKNYIRSEEYINEIIRLYPNNQEALLLQKEVQERRQTLL